MVADMSNPDLLEQEFEATYGEILIGRCANAGEFADLVRAVAHEAYFIGRLKGLERALLIISPREPRT